MAVWLSFGSEETAFAVAVRVMQKFLPFLPIRIIYPIKKKVDLISRIIDRNFCLTPSLCQHCS